MISIILEKGTLDIPNGTEISTTYIPYRFAESITDSFSNDFQIPNTRHNAELLDVQGLLYANNQRYGDEIKPAVININGEMKDARIQVVSANDKEITICLYVNEIPESLKGKTLRQFFTDDQNTIVPWYLDSQNQYPSMFPAYDYGMPYRTYYAQRHTSMPLSEILYQIQRESGVTIQRPTKNYYVTALHRNVCPQNTKQTLIGYVKDGEQTLKVVGSQHITNDLELSENDKITFNRKCNVNFDIYVSWDTNKEWYSYLLVLVHNANTNTNRTHSFQLSTPTYTNKVEHFILNLDLDEGDEVEFSTEYSDKFDIFQFQAEMIVNDYDITEDDYNIELQYSWKRTELEVDNELNRNDNYITYQYKRRGHPADLITDVVPVKRLPYSYFGFWCNVENVKVTDLLYHLGFIEGKEAVWDNFRNEINFFQSNRYKVLDDAIIEEYRPSSDKFAQNNYIKFKGDETPDPISTIDSLYLEDEKTLKESIFAKVYTTYDDGYRKALIPQYSNPEYDSDSKKYSCDFEDIEGLCLTEYVRMRDEKTALWSVTINPNGFDKITSVMEVKLNDLKGEDLAHTDYIYKNGVKMMITDIQTTLNPNGNTNNITAVVIPEKFE